MNFRQVLRRFIKFLENSATMGFSAPRGNSKRVKGFREQATRRKIRHEKCFFCL